MLFIYVIIDSVLGYLDNSTQGNSPPHVVADTVLLYALTDEAATAQALSKLNKFYIAERNLILTFSCLVVAYILRKMVLAIACLNELENEIEINDKVKTE